MTTAANTNGLVPQGAVSVPLTVSVAENLFRYAEGLHHKGAGSEMAPPMFPITKDARQHNLMNLDIAATLTPEAAQEFTLASSTVSGEALVTSSVNGVPHAKKDYTIFKATEKDKEDEIKLQRLAKKFRYVGVVRSNYNSATGAGQGSADQKISVDFHCYSGVITDVEEDMPNFTVVRMTVHEFRPSERILSSDSISRTTFGLAAMDTQSVADYAEACLRTYVGAGLKGTMSMSGVAGSIPKAAISFFQIRERAIHSNVVMKQETEVGHLLALNYTGLLIKGVEAMMKHAILPRDPSKSPEMYSKELAEIFGLVSQFNGQPHSQMQTVGFAALEEIFSGKKSGGGSAVLNNICNNALSGIAKTITSVVHEDYERVGTVYSVRQSTDHADPHKKMVAGFFSSLY